MGETDNLSIGNLVLSIKGRDKDKLYLVWELVDKDYVLLVDGSTRKIYNPKKKKKKHLFNTGIILESIKSKIQNNLKVFDSEIYSNIKKSNKLENQE